MNTFKIGDVITFPGGVTDYTVVACKGNNIYDLSDWIGLKQIYGKFQQSSSPESETRVGSKPFKNLGPPQLKSKSNFLPKSD